MSLLLFLLLLIALPFPMLAAIEVAGQHRKLRRSVSPCIIHQRKDNFV